MKTKWGQDKMGTGIFSKLVASSPQNLPVFLEGQEKGTARKRKERKRKGTGIFSKSAASSPQNLPMFHAENQKGKILSLSFFLLFSSAGTPERLRRNPRFIRPSCNPERIESLSPGLAQQRLPWVTSKATPTLNGLDQTNTLANPPRRPICSKQAEDLPIP
jgi:hypothetical protein